MKILLKLTMYIYMCVYLAGLDLLKGPKLTFSQPLFRPGTCRLGLLKRSPQNPLNSSKTDSATLQATLLMFITLQVHIKRIHET